MLSLLHSRFFAARPAQTANALSEAAAQALADGLASVRQELGDLEESTIFRTLGWVTAGLGAVALGLFVGRELRQRYKFNRRTPYDFYSHSGDEQDLEFGVGV